jgi:hypothetical protein
MCTIAGGEKVDDIDQIAPVVPDETPAATAPVVQGPEAAPTAPSEQANAPAGWQFVTSTDGYIVLMPEGGIKKQRLTEKTPAGEIPTTVVAIETKAGGIFNVTSGDLSKTSVKPGESDNVLESLRRGIAGSVPPGAKIASEANTTLDGNPAHEVNLEMPGKPPLKTRLAVIGSHFYVLMASGAEKDLQTFFDSFKLTGK